MYVTDKVAMHDFTIVLHGTDTEPGKAASSSPSSVSPQKTSYPTRTRLSQQNISPNLPSTNSLDPNDITSDRHDPDTPYSSHSGRAGDSPSSQPRHQNSEVDDHLPDGAGHSAAPRPVPLSLTNLMTDGPSVKKAGVDDHSHPTPASVTAPTAPSPDCSILDTNTSTCLGLCLLILLLHCLLAPTFCDGMRGDTNVLCRSDHSSAARSNASKTQKGNCLNSNSHHTKMLSSPCDVMPVSSSKQMQHMSHDSQLIECCLSTSNKELYLCCSDRKCSKSSIDAPTAYVLHSSSQSSALPVSL